MEHVRSFIERLQNKICWRGFESPGTVLNNSLRAMSYSEPSPVTQKPDDKLRNILFLDRKYDTMLGDYVSTDMTDTERKSVWQKQLPNRSSGMS